MEKKSIIIIMTLFLFAALEMPASASAASGLAADDPLVESEVGFIPGYGIIAYTISLNANPATIPADGSSESLITAQLKDKNGNNVQIGGVSIHFANNKGTLNANNVLTNSNGIASVTLTSSNNQGTASIRAYSDSVLIPGKTNVMFSKPKSSYMESSEALLKSIMGLFLIGN